MSKRKTKKQRERDQKDTLRNNVWCVCCGAMGMNVDVDNDIIGVEELSRIAPALREMFRGEQVTDAGACRRDHLFSLSNLDSFYCVNSITDLLFNHGVRA